MHPIIYSISPKDALFNSEKKSKFIVIKTSDSKLKNFINKDHTPTIELKDNNKYTSSDKNLLSFKVEKDRSKAVLEYLKTKLKEFINEHGIIEEKSPNDFRKFLEADNSYHFEELSSNEKLSESTASIKLPILNEELASSQNFLDVERNSGPRSRSNSLSDTKTETGSLRRINSSPKLSNESSDMKSEESLASSQKSIESQSQKLYNDQLAREIQSVFFEKNETFVNINKHGSVLQNGYFNGQEKSIHLLLISERAKNIGQDSHDLLNNPSSTVDVETLKHNINELNDYIKNKQTTDVLSRYRGFSPLRCFATLWGGGEVTSIKYVKELQKQLDTLTKNISDIRPTV